MKLKILILASVISFVAVSCGKSSSSSSSPASDRSAIEGIWSYKSADSSSGAPVIDAFKITDSQVTECKVIIYSDSNYNTFINGPYDYTYQDSTITVSGIGIGTATYNANTITYAGNIYSPISSTDLATINSNACGF